MAYTELGKIKKNSVSTTLSSDINSSVTTIPVTELSRFYADGVLITKGIVLGFDNADQTYAEEITITGASGTSGAGNLTGATRGVNADGTIGAAREWDSGTKIAVMFTTGIYNNIRDDIIALNAALGSSVPVGVEWTTNATSPTLVQVDQFGNTTPFYSTDFARHPIFAAIRRCNLSDAGVVNAYYGDATFSYTGSNGQVMVQIPKFYYRVAALTNKYRYTISPIKYIGYKTHPMFIVDGVEKDYVYVSAFEGSVFDVSAAETEVDTVTVTGVTIANGNIELLIDGNYQTSAATTTADDTVEKVRDAIFADGNQTDYQSVVWTVAKVDTDKASFTAGSNGLKTTILEYIQTKGGIGSGTVAAADATTLTKTSAGWTVNGWAGYICKILTGTGAGSYGVIASNTATVLTVADWLGGADPAAGSTFSITPTGVFFTVTKSTSGANGYVLNDSAGVDFTASTGDKLVSIAGVKPLTGWNNATATLPAMRQLAQNRGAGWNLMDANLAFGIYMLQIIRFATLNSQSVYRGVVDITDATAGNTYNNSINTGFTAGVGTNGVDLGNASGECPLVTHYKTAEAAKAFSIFGVENFWGNRWDWIDGLNIKADRNPWIADHDFASDVFAHPYVDTGFTLPSSNNYGVSVVYSATHDYMFLPLTVGGADNQYLCDYYYQGAGNRSARLGGDWANAAQAGACYWALSSAASGVYRTVGARLAFK